METVIATGLLILGLAVIGAQVQKADTAVKKMERRLRAINLAEMQLAELDLGLIELDSIDEIQEGDFGPRYADWGWLLTTEECGLEDLYLLRLDVLYHPREEDYTEDSFDFDSAETIHTVYAMRTAPQALDFAIDFGLGEEELEDLGERLAEVNIPGFDLSDFDPTLLAKVDIEELLEVLPIVMDAFGFGFEDIAASLPRDIVEELKQSGFFDEQDEEGGLGPSDGGGGG